MHLTARSLAFRVICSFIKKPYEFTGLTAASDRKRCALSEQTRRLEQWLTAVTSMPRNQHAQKQEGGETMIKSHGRYTVTIADDGAILVKQGDWLSKYSAAIHRGDTTKIHEYGRLRGGKMTPVPDPNRISAGEKLYHVPTFANDKLKKSEKKLKQAIDFGKRLQSQIARLKKSQSVHHKEIERLEKEVEGLEGLAEDAADECSEMYSCIGAGMVSQKFTWEAKSLDIRAQGLRKLARSVSKSIEVLEQRLQKNLKEQEELRGLVQAARRTLSREFQRSGGLRAFQSASGTPRLDPHG
ncbi:MAG: hypothetical protein SRB2_00593 [Desulfobacteraceae bacterium Eth-SRB2]|nr:MAG: hypothetical protein SRB2_00593 [Desulfobacteraceae bacterium Eth-SRB2]